MTWLDCNGGIPCMLRLCIDLDRNRDDLWSDCASDGMEYLGDNGRDNERNNGDSGPLRFIIDVFLVTEIERIDSDKCNLVLGLTIR